MIVSKKRRNSAPLSPCRFIEVADEKGVYCGKLLAELGADTIKVEKPGGDDTRNIHPFAGDDPHTEKGFFSLYYNQTKKGITLNLECRDGQEIFKRLMRNADVIVESFPPGYLDSLGIDYTALNVPCGIYHCKGVESELLLMHGFAMNLPKSPGIVRRPALLGEYNEYVLNEPLGLPKAEINQLVESEVLV